MLITRTWPGRKLANRYKVSEWATMAHMIRFSMDFVHSVQHLSIVLSIVRISEMCKKSLLYSVCLYFQFTLLSNLISLFPILTKLIAYRYTLKEEANSQLDRVLPWLHTSMSFSLHRVPIKSDDAIEWNCKQIRETLALATPVRPPLSSIDTSSTLIQRLRGDVSPIPVLITRMRLLDLKAAVVIGSHRYNLHLKSDH